jgi:Spy/CpxP family protein refolding chaperone
MKKTALAAVAALVLAGSGLAYTAVAAPDAPGPHHMADAGFLLDAKLAGMKAALKLTPEQDKLWPPFETAVRDGVKLRTDAMREMRDEEHGEPRPSPIAMMTEMSDHLAKASEALKKVADTAKPLYDSLDDSQKSHFGPLLHMLREGGPHHGPWGGEHEGPGPKPL